MAGQAVRFFLVPPRHQVIIEGIQVIDRIGIKQVGGVIVHFGYGSDIPFGAWMILNDRIHHNLKHLC